MTSLQTFPGEKRSVIFMILLGWSCYAFADFSIKLLAENYHIWQIMMTGSGCSCFILGLWILLKHGLEGFVPEKPFWQALRSVIVCIVAICVVNSISRIPLSDFYGITFFAPFLTLILVHFLLKGL